MRTAHICCGRGGSLWTGAILGWRNVLAFDNDRWRCQAVAADGWPGLTTVCGDVDGFPWHSVGVTGVDCIAAGFSCRDISSAGRRAGLDGKSTGPTWRGCLQAVESFRPDWVFFENSPRIKPYRPTIWQAMRDRGYDPRDGTLDAADVGAPHKRRRWFMLAVRSDIAAFRAPNFSWRLDGQTLGSAKHRTMDRNTVWDSAARVPEPGRDEGPHQRDVSTLQEAGGEAIQAAARHCGAHHWNPTDTGLRRMVDGLADRGKRIAALGDAWVPLQAAAAWLLLGGPVGGT